MDLQGLALLGYDGPTRGVAGTGIDRAPFFPYRAHGKKVIIS